MKDHTMTAAEPLSANAEIISMGEKPIPVSYLVLCQIEEFLDNQADVDDGIPNDAMKLLIKVRDAIHKHA